MTIGLSGLGVDLAVNRHVTIVLDGTPTTVNVVYGSVAEVLASQHIELEQRDQVTPDLSTVVTDGMQIDVDYARPIDLTLNGQHGVYWTYATTVGDVIKALGLGNSSLKSSETLETVVPRAGMPLTLAVGYNVSVTADGKTQNVQAYGTVQDALSDLGLTWDNDDIITPAPATPLANQMAITLVRVTQQTVTRDSSIPFTTQNSDDPNSPQGKVVIVTPGANGVLQETVQQVLNDGAVVSETVTNQTVLTAPVTQVTKTGTKPADPPSSSNSSSAPISVTPGSAQAIAQEMVAARGWDNSQFQCLVNLWNRESGWRVNASNGSSGAYGIPQALPGSKMATVGADWQTNPATQITWGLNYISGRYGTPCGAWSSFQAQGWY